MTVLKQRSQELQTVAWRSGKVRLIDQTALPDELRYVNLADWREVAEAIRTMVVRGAPAIGCTAALGLAQSARGIIAESREALIARMEDIAGSLEQARPTAVNLGWAVRRVMRVAENTPGSADDVRDAVLEEALDMLAEDVEVNRRLGSYGAERLPAGGSVLTHCNAGALATVAFGTALGVIRAAVEAGKRIHVYADETRPRLQGMKLTAWELARDCIPVTIITDSMAAGLMRQGKIDCVVVGADRIAANGDTVNKVGTYSVAVNARYHNVPFYVAAPLSTFDLAAPHGERIPIEERDAIEMTHVEGIRVAPEGVPVLNPAFDVTPAELVTAFFTEQGVIEPPYKSAIRGALRGRDLERGAE